MGSVQDVIDELVSVRLDIDDAFRDVLRYVPGSDGPDSRRCQEINLAPEKILKIVCKVHEPKTYGAIELDHYINITQVVGLIPRHRAKQPYPAYTELVAKIVLVLPQKLNSPVPCQQRDHPFRPLYPSRRV